MEIRKYTKISEERRGHEKGRSHKLRISRLQQTWLNISDAPTSKLTQQETIQQCHNESHRSSHNKSHRSSHNMEVMHDIPHSLLDEGCVYVCMYMCVCTPDNGDKQTIQHYQQKPHKHHHNDVIMSHLLQVSLASSANRGPPNSRTATHSQLVQFRPDQQHFSH